MRVHSRWRQQRRLSRATLTDDCVHDRLVPNASITQSHGANKKKTKNNNNPGAVCRGTSTRRRRSALMFAAAKASRRHDDEDEEDAAAAAAAEDWTVFRDGQTGGRSCCNHEEATQQGRKI